MSLRILAFCFGHRVAVLAIAAAISILGLGRIGGASNDVLEFNEAANLAAVPLSPESVTGEPLFASNALTGSDAT